MSTVSLNADEGHVLIKTTEDGRRVEVIDGAICLDGHPEAYELVPVDEHPNRQAIKRAMPRASHVAGRLPLTEIEAGMAQAAIFRMRDTFSADPREVMERLRKRAFDKAWREGIE